jgi:adenylate kinase
MVLVLILLGPPGAGKGTQAEHLCRDLDVPHVSTGDLFRENSAQGTELGQRAQAFMDKGELVPDEVVIDMLFDRVSRPDCEHGYLLDGFPRTVAQAEALEARLSADATVRALELQVPDDELISRLTGRLTCRDCSAMYHKRFSPPATADACDKCGGELYQREDDSEEVVAKRLSVYAEQTLPLIEFYAGRGVLTAVDGNRPQVEVSASLISAAREEAA